MHELLPCLGRLAASSMLGLDNHVVFHVELTKNGISLYPEYVKGVQLLRRHQNCDEREGGKVV
jgi:hypothetical protein